MECVWLLGKIIRRLKIDKIFRRLKNLWLLGKSLRRLKKSLSPSVLNEGERYDPNLGWTDTCHVMRYEFARQHLAKEDTVLDIACGTGYGTAMLADVCKKAVGVDISSEAVTYAAAKYKRSNNEFLVSDLFGNTVMADIVVSLETIEHVVCSDTSLVLKALVAFATKKIIGSVPYMETPGNSKHHYWFNLSEDSLSVLQEYGEISIFYQTPAGEIHAQKPVGSEVQSLVFVLNMTQE